LNCFLFENTLLKKIPKKIVMVSKKQPTPTQSPENFISSFGICLFSNSITVTLTKCKRVKFGEFLKRFQIKRSGRSRGGQARAPPLFWVKKEEMTEGRKAGGASKTFRFKMALSWQSVSKIM